MSLRITVYTPTQTVCDTITDEVVIPIENGQFVIRGRHQKHCAALSVGLLRIKTSDSYLLIIIFGGMAHVEDDKITIFVSEAEKVRSVNISEIESELKLMEVNLKTFTSLEKKMQAYIERPRLNALIKAARYL